MKKVSLFAIGALLVPGIAAAQTVQRMLVSIVDFFNDILIPFVAALALLFFFINITRYFIIGGGNEEGRTKARSLATWGILAFFLIISIWGVVNLLVVSALGFRYDGAIIPDYVCESVWGSCSP